MEIRHLKDRMIRKCQRLATPPGAQTHAQAADVSFRTVYAPPDFRLKEMEKYLKTQETKPRKGHQQDGRHLALSPQQYPSDVPLTPPRPSDYPGHALSPDSASPRTPDLGRSPLQGGHRPLSPVTFEGGYTPDPQFPIPEPHDPLVYEDHPPSPPAVPPESVPLDLHELPDPGPPQPGDYTPNTYTEQRMLSPEPLPVPYRGSRSFSPLPGEDAAGGFASFGDLIAPLPALDPALTPELTPVASPEPPPVVVPIPDLDLEAALETDSVGPLPERPLVRRRSSLKRRDSGSRLSLNGSVRGVSFAMDLSRTEMVARDVEVAANELNELRETYRSQLARIRQERQSIADTLAQLHLQEESLRKQEDSLHATYQALDEKELQYRNKGRCLMWFT
jgi:hypothetical protein